jgi:hypothetical protein
MSERKEFDLRKYAAEQMKLMAAELEAWRSRHPREASYVAEEARAKVEGREPNYGQDGIWG